jgi:hypothetical protein
METPGVIGSSPKPGPEQSNPWRDLPRFVAVVSIVTLVVVSAIVLAATLATGFSFFPQRIPGAAIGNSVNAELGQHEKAGIATVDFDTLVPGKWSKLVIACFDSTNTALNDALGFPWPEGPDMSDKNFFAMLVFSTGSRVEKYYNIGQNDLHEDWYFTPCTSPVGGGAAQSQPIVIDRRASKIEFVFDNSIDGHHFWYVPRVLVGAPLALALPSAERLLASSLAPCGSSQNGRAESDG